MKEIYTVQHTQSAHHTNGMVGSWADWDLTPLGVEQAGPAACPSLWWSRADAFLRRVSVKKQFHRKKVRLRPDFQDKLKPPDGQDANREAFSFDFLLQITEAL